MQSTWQDFLLKLGAELDNANRLFFNHDARSEINAANKSSQIASLDHLGVILVSGDDAQSFLQSQLSNDIKLIDSSSCQISAYCNPKGRILAQFLIIPKGADYYLIFPRSIMEATLKRLSMFVMRAQVVLQDVSNEFICLGLIGDADINDANLKLPAAPYQVNGMDSILIAKLPAPITRHLILAPIQQAQSLWSSLQKHHSASGHHVWQWLDIQAGIPSIGVELSEEFVPQMVNLELIDAVNFKKGCYPGQEIVARMHYLGKPKRRMFKLYSQHDIPPTPGTDIYLKGGDGQSAGKIVLAEPAQSKGIDMLAVIRLSYQNTELLQLSSDDGIKLEFTDQPYPLEPEEAKTD